VYTKNDFTQNGGGEIIEDSMAVTRLDRRVPYLITEYNGHMYPTKKYDCEERQSEFVLRHLRVQNAMLGDPWISGAIGWCMFDYNTHHDFGAGDRICYHGVMDMFRIPKFAAWAYASQVDPAKEVVLKPVTCGHAANAASARFSPSSF
jgi:beta-galactosidase